jgi:hypothetical protein
MFAWALFAQCTTSTFSVPVNFYSGSIAVTKGFGASNSLLNAGISYWESACPQSGGQGFPNMKVCQCSSAINVEVNYVGGTAA